MESSPHFALGESTFLGCPYWEPESVVATFRSARDISDPYHDPNINIAARYIIDTGGGRYFVIRGSKCEEMLRTQIAEGKVTVVDFDSAIRLMLQSKQFIFLDNEEDSKGLGSDVIATAGGLLPNLITVRHLNVFRAYFSFLISIAECVRTAAQKDKVQFTLLVANTYTNKVISDILYMLVGEIETTVAPLAHIFTLPHTMSPSIPWLKKKKRAMLVWNCGAATTELREFMRLLSGNDFYFIHGSPRKCLNSCFLRNSVAFFAISGFGQLRMMSMLRPLLEHLGLEQQKRGLSEQINYILQHSESDDERRDRIRNALTLNSYGPPAMHCIREHRSMVWDIFADFPGIDSIFPCRDARDMLLSNFFFSHVMQFRYGGVEYDPLLLDFVAKYDNPILKQLTEYKCKNRSNTAFIRFEETYSDPIKAYMEPLTRLGYDQDPFWLNMEARIAYWASKVPVGYRSQENAIAHLPKVIQGKPGAWKTKLTSGMKTILKERGYGDEYLKAFGYEVDDNW